MRSLTLFAPTFTRVHSMLQNLSHIKNKTFRNTLKRLKLEMIGRAFLVANSIERNVTEIQSPLVEEELVNIQSFLKNRDLSISYDYQRKGFQLEPKNENDSSYPRMHVRSSIVQKFDHPHVRESLYFHELKDIQKYFEIKYPNKSPKFIHDIWRRNAQNQLLDSRNPLGLPVDAPPLMFMINMKDKFIVEYYCRFGNINIRTVRLLSDKVNEKGERKCHYILSGMNIPRQIQKIVNDYCKEELLLDEPEFYRLHRLSYIGGRIEQIQNLLDLYNFFATNIDS